MFSKIKAFLQTWWKMPRCDSCGSWPGTNQDCADCQQHYEDSSW